MNEKQNWISYSNNALPPHFPAKAVVLGSDSSDVEEIPSYHFPKNINTNIFSLSSSPDRSHFNQQTDIKNNPTGVFQQKSPIPLNNNNSSNFNINSQNDFCTNINNNNNQQHEIKNLMPSPQSLAQNSPQTILNNQPEQKYLTQFPNLHQQQIPQQQIPQQQMQQQQMQQQQMQQQQMQQQQILQQQILQQQISQQIPSNIDILPKFPTNQLNPSIVIPNSYPIQIGKTIIKFPYEKPHLPQLELMSKSLLAFESCQNALLESPTGTGKSAALLAASLAFQEQHPDVTRVFYTSRTHAQLKQLVSELKRLPYFPRLSMLASRRHLCIHRPVAKSGNVDIECRKALSKSTCPFVKNINNLNSSNNSQLPLPIDFTPQGKKPKYDLEDLIEYGIEHNRCPYMISKLLFQNASFVICPYNYIIAPNKGAAMMMQSGHNSTIAIFDEGHNIENISRDEASFSMHYFQSFTAGNDAAKASASNSAYSAMFTDIRLITADIDRFINSKRREYNEANTNDRPNQNQHQNFRQPQNGKQKYMKGPPVQKVFTQVNPVNLSNIGQQMLNWVNVIVNNPNPYQSEFSTDSLIAFCEMAGPFFTLLTPANFDSFRVAFVPDEKEANNDMIKILCMRPAVLFEGISKATRSTVITSGTLSPLDSFAAELETDFPIKVSAGHVVDPSQVLAITINQHNGIPITSKYSVLQSQGEKVYEALGQIVEKTITTVPGGSLLFMPSYFTKEGVVKRWKHDLTYERISQVKAIVEETSEMSAKKIIKRYNAHTEGALLIGVCRGKISEGLDFSDDLARIVYVFGIPFPGIKEADVEMKMQYNNSRHAQLKTYLSGNDWYNAQAFRALFQSVGRCLRHNKDYGAIVFLDSRIESNLSRLPKWLSKNLHSSMTTENATKLLASFYNDMRQKFPPKPRTIDDLNNTNDNDDFKSFKNISSDNISKDLINNDFMNNNHNYSNCNNYDDKLDDLIESEDIKIKPSSFDLSLTVSQQNLKKSALQLKASQLQNSNNKVFNEEDDNKTFSNNDYKSYLNNNNNNNNDFYSYKQKYQAVDFRGKAFDVVDSDDEDQSKLMLTFPHEKIEAPKANPADDNPTLKDSNNFATTNIFCAECSNCVARIRHLELANFVQISSKEFFDVLGISQATLVVMSVEGRLVKTSFLNNSPITKWSERDNCALNRKTCQCGAIIAGLVKSAGDGCKFSQGDYIFRKELLAMQMDGKLTPFSAIASS